MTDDRSASLGTDLCQFRIFLDFDSPTLVFGQMPMEHIHVMESQHVDVFLDKRNWEEMASTIQHHTTVSKLRRILDDGSRQFNVFRRIEDLRKVWIP